MLHQRNFSNRVRAACAVCFVIILVLWLTQAVSGFYLVLILVFIVGEGIVNIYKNCRVRDGSPISAAESQSILNDLQGNWDVVNEVESPVGQVNVTNDIFTFSINNGTT